MKIVRADVIVTCPGRNFVTLKIVTDEGVHGIGDATLNGRELAVASYLKDHVCPLLIGRDPGRIEDTWQYLYKGAYWRRGPVTMTAIAAVDMALWDILGKVTGMPLYKLLGGASREGVMVYGHATGRDIPEALDRYAEHIEAGYQPFAFNAACRTCARYMAYRKAAACTSRRRRALSKSKAGRRKSISTLCPSSSKRCAPSSASTRICCTTCTIA